MAIATKLGILGFSGSLIAILISVLQNYSPSQHNPELRMWTWGATSSLCFFIFSFFVFFKPQFWIRHFEFFNFDIIFSISGPKNIFFLRFDNRSQIRYITCTYAENSSKIVIFYEFKKWNKKNLPPKILQKIYVTVLRVNWLKKICHSYRTSTLWTADFIRKKWFFSISFIYNKLLINNFTQFFMIITLHEPLRV